ncbi:MAG: Cof-type HAD-IIB family hydrolase [Christensenellaceae bacterium]|nr:Cof-type HAD-IIB family hydrolase [Christensenellaceae bacterium]
MIKAVFFDVDGTLMSHAQGCVPDGARRAVARLRARGIKAFVATGRFKGELEELHFLDGMGFDGYVGSNGQYCWDLGGVFFARPLDDGDVQTVLKLSASVPFACGAVCESGLFINRVDDDVLRAQAGISTAIPPVRDLAELAAREPFYQMIAFKPAPFDRELVRALSNTDTARWHARAFDLLPRGGGKHKGARVLLERHGIRPDEALAIGDGENDLSLFRFAGASVAMGNAADAVKASATYVTSSVDEDGIERALRHFGLIDATI